VGMKIGAAVVRRMGDRVTVGAATRLPGGAAAVELPTPPSVNNLFLTAGRRRVKAPAYRAWLAVAVPAAAGLARPAGPCRVVVTVVARLRANRDLDNLLKPVGDCLVAAGVLAADDVRSVVGWQVDYRPTPGGAGVVVELADTEGRADR
jgi:Holliday junction resolvase RusA-like endonuclease